MGGIDNEKNIEGYWGKQNFISDKEEMGFEMKKKIIVLLIAAMSMNSLAVSAASSEFYMEQDMFEDTKVYEETTDTLPTADVFLVDFSNGMEDLSENPSELHKKIGSPVIQESTQLGTSVGNFNGKSASLYSFTQDKYEKISKNVTMECMVKFNDLKDGEREFFSNQEYGGIGFGLDNTRLTFYAHVGGDYRQPSCEIQANQWYHIAGVVSGTEVKLYVNGQLMETNTDASYDGILYPSDPGSWNMVLGADSDDDNMAQAFANADLAFAKIYSEALTDEQVGHLSEKSFENAQEVSSGPVNLGFVSSSSACEEAFWDLNIHANKNNDYDVDKIEYDIVYDSSVLTYTEAENLRGAASVTETEPGRLHIVLDEGLSKESFRRYDQTRVAKLHFKTQNVESTQETLIQTENFKAYYAGEDITDTMDSIPQAQTSIQIESKDQLDFNGDGVIGAGDVALAPEELKEATAAISSIYPYKHAVILTVDGAGTVWNPDAIYYAPDNWTTPVLHSDPETMSKRKNTYAMDLLNKEFASSYTAQSVEPSISAQNYFSILHGIPWAEVSQDYQVDNGTTGEEYFTDYNRSPGLYPSVFQGVSEAFPNRPNAAFTEWTNIIDGIIESQAMAAGKGSGEKQSFYDVAEYIRSDAYKNTALVYMQSDWMDHVGHGSGYYNDNYWNELEQYDEFYQAVVEALKESGEYEETLIITNADHGGSGTNHGSTDPSNMDVFIGVGGQTVNSGVRLEGGSNADIPAIALTGLRAEIPESMTGQVFDQNMFLSQNDIYQKGRDIEAVHFFMKDSKGILNLSNEREQIRVVDAVFTLNGAQPAEIDAKGGEILRQELGEDTLKLTIAYEQQPKQLADIQFEMVNEQQPVLQEIMLGTEAGEEIYPDIYHDDNVQDNVDLANLILAVNMAEELEKQQENYNCYTLQSWNAVKEVLDQARRLVEGGEGDQALADQTFLDLMTACNLLENEVLRTGLKAAIEGTEAILENERELAEYSRESVEAVRTALEEAQRVYEEESADQETVNLASRSLMDAVTSLLVQREDHRLNILIQKAKELLEKKEQYTDASIGQLEEALQLAEKTAQNPQATDDERANAYNELVKAMTELVRKAEKSELKNALEKAEEILDHRTDYVKESIKNLSQVKDAAQIVYEDEAADASQVGEAVKRLVGEILKARLLGDVNADGTVDTADSSEILKFAAELRGFTEPESQAADVNQDGKYDSSDAVVILKYTAEIEEF